MLGGAACITSHAFPGRGTSSSRGGGTVSAGTTGDGATSAPWGDPVDGASRPTIVAKRRWSAAANEGKIDLRISAITGGARWNLPSPRSSRGTPASAARCAASSTDSSLVSRTAASTEVSQPDPAMASARSTRSTSAGSSRGRSRRGAPGSTRALGAGGGRGALRGPAARAPSAFGGSVTASPSETRTIASSPEEARTASTSCAAAMGSASPRIPRITGKRSHPGLPRMWRSMSSDAGSAASAASRTSTEGPRLANRLHTSTSDPSLVTLGRSPSKWRRSPVITRARATSTKGAPVPRTRSMRARASRSGPSVVGGTSQLTRTIRRSCGGSARGKPRATVCRPRSARCQGSSGWFMAGAGNVHETGRGGNVPGLRVVFTRRLRRMAAGAALCAA